MIFKLFTKIKGTVKAQIEDIIGLYSCDIVLFDNLNDEIKKQIERDGIRIA